MLKTTHLTKITKRDGREVPFSPEKITDAIYRAAVASGGSDRATSEDLTNEVIERLEANGKACPTVEEVQDMVEKTLIENGHAKTAKSYILYRADRTKHRSMNTQLMKIYEDLTFKSAAENDVKRENANIDGDTAMGTMLKYGSEGSKAFYDMFILEPAHSKAHNAGDIHIHDLDFYTLTTTCCQIDIQKLFDGGFSTGHGHLREPNHIQSYSALACIAIQSNQNDQHGGQSIPNFDYGLADGVAKSYILAYRENLAKSFELLAGLDSPEAKEKSEELLRNIKLETELVPCLSADSGFEDQLLPLLVDFFEDEVIAEKALNFTVKNAWKETDRQSYKAMVALIHNLNTMHSRAGAQVPFSSINYGTDTSEEGRMVTRNLLLATEAGLGHGETPIFPVQIFKVKEGINYNPEDKNYDLFQLACEVSAKRLFPNFSFLDAPFNLEFYKEGHPETEVSYMGCRTRVMSNVDKENEVAFGRGNLSFTSINLPRLAILSHRDLATFYKLLDERIDLVIEQLLHRYDIQKQKLVRNYPFLMGQGVWIGSENLNPDDGIEDILKHGTLSVGFIGLAETLKALIGEHHGESDRAQELGLKIVSHMRRRMDEATEKYQLNFSLIATPAEGLSGRFVKIDRRRFGEIPGVTDRDYYTNSFHVPVYYPISAYEKIQKEAPYHALTNGGHISYVEVDGDPRDNVEAFMRIIRCMKESGVGYGSINHPIDRDPVCGYNGIIGDTCPKCGRHEEDGPVGFERIRRITGYLVGTLDRFNNGKRAEEHDRVKHISVYEQKSIEMEQL